jgi:hypothetical protein
MLGGLRVKQRPNLLKGEPEPTAAQAKAQARAEGLALVRADNATGCKGVYRHYGRFKVEAREGDKSMGKHIYLGTFSTPEAAAEAAEPEVTAKQAKAQARAEGLMLVGADNATGFKGMCRNHSNFKAHTKEGGKRLNLGSARPRRPRWRMRATRQ